MIFKSIEIEDFRQFKGTQKIVFSTDPNKMITLIDGNNGAGKTTFVQAFNWCLFGVEDTNLDSKHDSLNNEVFNQLVVGEEAIAKINVVFEHNGSLYSVIRTQTTTKKIGNIRSVKGQTIKCTKKNEDGISETINSSEINKIIPYQLSTYFFFDGERMKDLNEAEGAKDLSKTITSLMGLEVLKTAGIHLDEVKRNYKRNKVTNSDSSVEILDRIEAFQNELTNYKHDLSRLNNSIEENKKKIDEKSQILLGFDPIKQLEKERKNIEDRNSRLTDDMKATQKSFFNSFWQNGHNIMLLNTMKEVYENIKDTDILDKGVEGLYSIAIDKIIERRECICGTCIEFESDEYKKLIDTKKYLPPENLSGLLRVMKVQLEHSEAKYSSFFNEFEAKYKKYVTLEIEKQSNLRTLEDIHLDITRIGEKLDGDINIHEQEKRDLEAKNRTFDQKIGITNLKIKDRNVKILKLSNEHKSTLSSSRLNNEIDDKIEICNILKKKFEAKYKEREDILKSKLEQSISTTLSQILHAERKVIIDDKYSFKAVDSFGNSVLSEGQKVVISFAYVKAISELSKEINSKKSQYHSSSTELPLVMDAPLATLDKNHRLNVCKVLPQFSKQIILFTTMSQLDEKSETILENHIGKRYFLNVIKDSAHTQVEELN